MLLLGIILLGVTGILWFVYRSQTNQAFSLQSAQSATPGELHTMSQAIADEIGQGNWREYVKVRGTIHCDRPLISPLKQQPCVFYQTRVTWDYEETVTEPDDDGNPKTTTQKQTKTISSDRQSVPFVITDQTGSVDVDADEADIDSLTVVNDFQPNQPLGDMLSYGDVSLDVSSYGRQAHQRTLGYRYYESILPLDRNILVVGMVSDHTHTPVIQKPSKSTQTFIVSLKQDDVLTAKAKQGAKRSLYGMVGCGVLGVIFTILGVLSG